MNAKAKVVLLLFYDRAKMNSQDMSLLFVSRKAKPTEFAVISFWENFVFETIF
jgi:hypothetical protein